MKKSFAIIFVVLSFFAKAHGQQFGIAPLLVPGFAYAGVHTSRAEAFWGGGGLELNYFHPLPYGKIGVGLEFRTIDWGSQVALNLGFNHPYASLGKWEFSGLANLQSGLALFYDHPPLVIAVEYLPKVEWITGKRSTLSLSAGPRFTVIPAYRQGIRMLWELPVRIGWHIRLGPKRRNSFE